MSTVQDARARAGSDRQTVRGRDEGRHARRRRLPGASAGFRRDGPADHDPVQGRRAGRGHRRLHTAPEDRGEVPAVSSAGQELAEE